MNCIEHHCQGESHKSTDKPCQDYAYAECSDGLSMAIVSDGHGGERYFRSQHGSAFAVEITKEAIRSFVAHMEEATFTPEGKKSVFEGEGLTTFSAATATDEQMDSRAHQALKWLFASIISQWDNRIVAHARENDLSEWELAHVEQKYQEEFLTKRGDPEATFEKTYGCTLMAYVHTPDYWFAFQLGDGKCVSMRIAEDKLVCEQPIPWDERCFLNKTTSLCDSNALEEFRYCYQGDGGSPLAVFLGSDGLDDSYGDGYNLSNFYIQLFKLIIKSGMDRAKKELVKCLPIISQKGSKDDMSVAAVFDDSNLPESFFLLTAFQKEEVSKRLNGVEDKILTLEKKIEETGDSARLDRGRQINLEYAQKDLVKAKEEAGRLDYRLRSIKGEETKFRKSLKVDEPVPASVDPEEETIALPEETKEPEDKCEQ